MEIQDNWQTSALCASSSYDPNMWFADPTEEQEHTATMKAWEQVCTARDVCRMCSVRTECLDYAMYRPFLQGIWGGLSGEERKTLRQVRARNDKSLVFGLFSEPDLSVYIRSGSFSQQSDAIVKALRARRTCQLCSQEQDYYISTNLGCCRDCALAQQQEAPIPSPIPDSA